MAEDLVKLLKLLDFERSESATCLRKPMFKTADNRLFRKIVCFVLSQFDENFKGFNALYSSSAALTKQVEGKFRIDLKDAIGFINKNHPYVDLKLINQSHLIAPQGPKVISFLIDFCRAAIVVKLRKDGLTYVPPSDSAATQQEFESIENIDSELEDLEREYKALLEEDRESVSPRLCQLRNNSHLPDDLKDKWARLEISPDDVGVLCNEITLKLGEKLKGLDNSLDALSTQINDVLSVVLTQETVEFDRVEVIEGLTPPASILNAEVMKDIKTNLESLSEIVKNEFLTSLLSSQESSVTFNKVLDLTGHFNSCFSEEYTKLCAFETQLKSKEEEMKREVDVMIEEATKRIMSSNEVEDQAMKDFLEMFDRPYEYDNGLPGPDIDIIKWTLGYDPKDRRNDKRTGTVKKSTIKRWKSFQSLRKTNVDKQAPLPKIRTALFKEMNEDRRATLASPSARSERFKIKHHDQQRKPLFPLKAKALFQSSSPIGHAQADTVSSPSTSSPLHNAQGDAGPSTPSSSLEPASDPLLSFGLGCGFNLHRTMSEPSLNITAELHKFYSDESDDLQLFSPTDASPC